MAIKAKTHTGSKRFAKAKQNKFLIGALVLVFLAAGVFFIYSSFASGIPVFRTDPDYWRPRIGQCESGNFYQNKKTLLILAHISLTLALGAEQLGQS